MAIHLVTGATDGIGLETAYELAKAGDHVLVHGRTKAKAEAALRTLAERASGERLSPVFGDLSSLAEIRALADQIDEVDVLVQNAGVFMTERRTTVDGLETTFAVNHLAPFVLTHLLLPKLRRREEPRVVVVSSMAHQSGRIDFDDLQMTERYDGHAAYASSKLMNVLFAYDLARRVPEVAVNALHPGVIATKLLRTGFGMAGADLAEGARTSVRLARDPALRGVSGRYFSNATEARSSRVSHDETLQRRLYEVSCALGGVEPIDV
jgi:NAD(P)-dependent dehydrogenase (short-subunit alcohol dehydrogenase family)